MKQVTQPRGDKRDWRSKWVKEEIQIGF
jgi:hypothetical protein